MLLKIIKTYCYRLVLVKLPVCTDILAQVEGLLYMELFTKGLTNCFFNERHKKMQEKKGTIISNTLHHLFQGFQRLTLKVCIKVFASCTWIDFREATPSFSSLFTGHVFRAASSESQIHKALLRGCWMQSSGNGVIQRRFCNVFIIA